MRLKRLRLEVLEPVRSMFYQGRNGQHLAATVDGSEIR